MRSRLKQIRLLKNLGLQPVCSKNQNNLVIKISNITKLLLCKKIILLQWSNTTTNATKDLVCVSLKNSRNKIIMKNILLLLVRFFNL